MLRKELRALICTHTHESFSSVLPLDKNTYKEIDATRITLNALISFHGLLLIDEVKSKINSSTTNISKEKLLNIIRDVWGANHSLRTHQQQRIFVDVAAQVKEVTSIGRNQAIDVLLNSTIKDIEYVNS